MRPGLTREEVFQIKCDEAYRLARIDWRDAYCELKKGRSIFRCYELKREMVEIKMFLEKPTWLAYP